MHTICGARSRALYVVASVAAIFVSSQNAQSQDTSAPTAAPPASTTPTNTIDQTGPQTPPVPSPSANGTAQAIPNATPVPDVRVKAPAPRKSKSQKAAQNAPAPASVSIPTDGEIVETHVATGTAADGYRVNTISTVGPFGAMPIKNAPYAISVVPHELMDNVQATTPNDALRINPFVVVTGPTERGGVGGYSVRGFALSNNWKSIDGISTFFTNENVEDKERIEVLQGVSGFLYGLGNPGGTINYVLKRPTAAPYASVTTGVVDNGEAYVHGDFGGPLTRDGSVGYRLNIVGEGGSTEVDNQDLTRSLVSAAIDWHATNHLLFQFDGSYATYHVNGQTTFWNLNSDFAPPKAKGAGQLWGGEPWTFQDSDQGRVAARMTWDINNIFTLRSAIQFLNEDSSSIFVNNFLDQDRTYSQLVIDRAPIQNVNLGGFAFLDAKFRVGEIENKVTTGYYAFGGWNYFTAPLAFSFLPNTFSYDAPSFITKPNIPLNRVPQTLGSKTLNQNIMIADEIKFTNWLSGLVGVNRTNIQEKDFNIASGDQTGAYDKSAWTPSGSIIFKPFSNLTTYVTYQQGFEQGAVVDPTFNGLPVTNADQVLPPGIDEQTEIGAKLEVDNTLWTVALFDLKRKAELFTKNSDNTYTASQDGVEEHKGVEFGVTGKVTDVWTIYGGLTALQARYREQSDPALVGTEPGDVPEFSAKIYSEYKITAVPGLTLMGDIIYVGEQKTMDLATHDFPSYLVGDIGMRYDTQIEGRDVTLRALVKNVTDEEYWASSNYIGQPRTFAVTAQMKF